jgi:hypothetical protein
MARIAKRLYGPALIATGPTTIYTVPALTKTKIRQIHIQNPSASPVTYTISIGADAAGTRIYSSYSIPAAGVTDSVRDHFFADLVLDATEILTASAGTNNILTITVIGAEEVLG